MTQTTIQHTPKQELHSRILKVCHDFELLLHGNHKGPKTFTNYQRVGLLVLLHRSGHSLRQFVSQLYESLWPKWLGLKEIPGKSTIQEWKEMFGLDFIRSYNSAIVSKTQPEVFTFDGTGVDSWLRSRHYQHRIGESYMPYAKLDIFVDVQTHIIHDFTLRVKPRADVVAAKTFVQRMVHKDCLILGDKAYDCEWLHESVIESGNLLFAPIRIRPDQKTRGRNRKRCAKGHEKYPLRSNVESVIHSLKALRVHALRSRKAHLKKREMGWHIIVHNLEKIIKIMDKIIWALRVFRTDPNKLKFFIKQNILMKNEGSLQTSFP